MQLYWFALSLSLTYWTLARDSCQSGAGLATWSSVAQWHNVIVACQIIKYCSQISLRRNQFQSRLRSWGWESQRSKLNSRSVARGRSVGASNVRYITYVIQQKAERERLETNIGCTANRYEWQCLCLNFTILGRQNDWWAIKTTLQVCFSSFIHIKA